MDRINNYIWKVDIIQYSPLLEPLHVVQDVELLPSLGEVDINVVGHQVIVADVHERQVLEYQATERPSDDQYNANH